MTYETYMENWQRYGKTRQNSRQRTREIAEDALKKQIINRANKVIELNFATDSIQNLSLNLKAVVYRNQQE